MNNCENETAVINTKKLDESTLVDKDGRIIGLWFKTREEATNADLMAGIMVLHQMMGRTIEQSDFDACRKGVCMITPKDGGYGVFFPSAK